MISVVDYIGQTVKKTSELLKSEVFYQHGHIRDINQILNDYSKTAENRQQKYPSIFLLQDFAEKRGIVNSIETEATLQLLIVAASNPDFLPKQRYENVFKPILYPIYKNFIKALNKSPLKAGYADVAPDFYIERLRLSDALTEPTKGQANLFNDHLDAIELRNLKVSIIKNC